MTVGSGGSSDTGAGGSVHHHPVLLPAVLQALKPQAGRTYIDATFGAGGYSRALLAHPGTHVIGIDRDPSAASAGAALTHEHPDRFTFRQARFGDLDSVVGELGLSDVDGVVFDIGVSSMQLDQAERGFSFRFDGPLDMRMESDGPSAADLINTADETMLAAILNHYGEERESRRIARAVVADRVAEPFLRTKPLADLVGRVVRGSPKGVHPATRTFQALRIAVNDELGQLLAGLEAAERVLGIGGVLAIVTFHSLEDRIAKRFLARAGGRTGGFSRHRPEVSDGPAASFILPSGQPVTPSQNEIDANPRARSAKLRWGLRTAAAPLGLDDELRSLSGLGLQAGRS